jgi:hypothetical protein
MIARTVVPDTAVLALVNGIVYRGDCTSKPGTLWRVASGIAISVAGSPDRTTHGSVFGRVQ